MCPASNGKKEEKSQSPIGTDHFEDPSNMGVLDNADGYAKITGSCGDTMAIWIKLDNNCISGISFMTDGCINAIACCRAATELAKGKRLADAKRIKQDDIIASLQRLPAEDKHCALLASNTLKKAISNYLIVKRAPWKKFYP